MRLLRTALISAVVVALCSLTSPAMAECQEHPINEDVRVTVCTDGEESDTGIAVEARTDEGIKIQWFAGVRTSDDGDSVYVCLIGTPRVCHDQPVPNVIDV